MHQLRQRSADNVDDGSDASGSLDDVDLQVGGEGSGFAGVAGSDVIDDGVLREVVLVAAGNDERSVSDLNGLVGDDGLRGDGVAILDEILGQRVNTADSNGLAGLNDAGLLLAFDEEGPLVTIGDLIALRSGAVTTVLGAAWPTA